MMDNDLKRSILLDHYQNPRNHALVDAKGYKLIHKSSSSCIDDLTIQVAMEGDIVKDIRFDGVGCTISVASTSIFSELLINKSREEALYIIDQYLKMLKEESYDETVLEEANAFETLSAQANRIKCGLIGVEAMREMIADET